MKTQSDAAVTSAYLPLRAAFGLVPILAGLDKFVNLLADWSSYIAPFAERLLPMGPDAFLYVVGVVEIGVGLLVWSRFVRIGAYAAAGWLLLVALNLLAAGYLDIAVRDVVLAIAAFSLARLTEARSLQAASPERAKIELGETHATS